MGEVSRVWVGSVMVDPGLFDDMMNMLSTQHQYWKPLDEFSRKAMLGRLNKFGVDTQEFGNYCLDVMGHKGLERADIVDFFKQKYLEDSHLKALPQAKVRADVQSEEFVRFVRMNRELRAALAKGKAYPTDKAEFHGLWQRSLTETDREYAEQRRESRRLQVMGVDIPIGGGHA